MADMHKRALKYMLLAILFTACKKDPPSQKPEEVVKVIPEVTPKGISTGAVITKQIGPQGGVLATPDQSCTITIPAGALNENTTIGIEPITNTNFAGTGKAYRLTPHGQQFTKPVAVRFSYAEHKDSITSPQMLGLSFQGEDGIWNFTGADAIDTVQKTVMYETQHFSDWALMSQIIFMPFHADLNAGEKVQIKAMLFVTVEDEDMVVPLPGQHPPNPYAGYGYPKLGKPEPLPLKYIDAWNVIGPGRLANNTGNTAEYLAPQTVNEVKTVTVTCKLKAPVQGTYILICTIHLMPDSWIEFDVAGRGPVLVTASPVVRTGNQYFLANPSNEGGGFFGLKWIGGVGAHSYDMDNGTTFHFIAPDATFVSMYRPRLEDDVVASGGAVNITHLGNGYVEGTFNVSDLGITPTLVPRTYAVGKFRAKLFEP